MPKRQMSLNGGEKILQQKTMSGRDKFLDLNSEWFLYFYVSDHIQQDIMAEHLTRVIYSQAKNKAVEIQSSFTFMC